MIKPTVGRVVEFFPGNWDTTLPRNDAISPLAAIVAYVWHDRMVNLAVFDANGHSWSRTSVQLLQDGDAKPAGNYAQWMVYQKGQAAKTEVAESSAAELGAEVRRLGLAGP